MTAQHKPGEAIESEPPATSIVRSRVDGGTVVRGRVLVRDSRASGAQLYGGAVLLGSAVGRVGVASSTISACVLP